MSAQMPETLGEDVTEDKECELSVDGGANLKRNKRLGKHSRRSGSQGGEGLSTVMRLCSLGVRGPVGILMLFFTKVFIQSRYG